MDRWRAWVAFGEEAGFFATDWGRLQMLVPLVEAFLSDPSPSLAREIRLNEEQFAAGERGAG